MTTKGISLALALSILTSVFFVFGAVSTSAAAKNVSLYSSSVVFSKYGASTYEVYVQTKENGSNQKVYVHYNYMNGYDWSDAEAKYVTTLNDGSKIWKATFSSFDTKYAIKFVSNGRVYWDNNNNKNYTGSDVIGTAPVTSERLGYQYANSNFKINAVLQNYSYNKNVVVRYTTDSWKTVKEQSMSYSKTNANGSETWTTALNLTGVNYDNFQYAICYKANGNEYWANNFNNNYDAYYYIHR